MTKVSEQLDGNDAGEAKVWTEPKLEKIEISATAGSAQPGAPLENIYPTAPAS